MPILDSENRKVVQFKMRADAYEALKARGKLVGLNAGDMVENLLASVEFRLNSIYELIAIEPNRSENTDKFLIKGLLMADQCGTFGKNLEGYFLRCRKQVKNAYRQDKPLSKWEPKVSFDKDTHEQ